MSRYDVLELDIDALHTALDDGTIAPSRLKSRLSPLWYPFYRRGIHARLVDAGIIRGWFDEFHEFWLRALDGRRLQYHDFFCLKHELRKRFQGSEVEENSGAERFLAAWQDSRHLYHLFHSVYKYAVHPFSYRPYRKLLRRGGAVLEYGCGLAPIVTSAINAGLRQCNYTIADIRTFSYTYAKFRLKQHNVDCVDIAPYEEPPLRQKYDAVFIITVLEHLPDPLAVVEFLTRRLERGGYFIFDYILSDGAGVDTVEAVKQRPAVLEYIARHYDVIKGSINPDVSIGETIVRKR